MRYFAPAIWHGSYHLQNGGAVATCLCDRCFSRMAEEKWAESNRRENRQLIPCLEADATRDTAQLYVNDLPGKGNRGGVLRPAIPIRVSSLARFVR
jgi:hypothetical protein